MLYVPSLVKYGWDQISKNTICLLLYQIQSIAESYGSGVEKNFGFVALLVAMLLVFKFMNLYRRYGDCH